MIWRIAILVVALGSIAINTGVEIVQAPSMAESVAERLGPKIGVGANSIRPILTDILSDRAYRRSVVMNVPALVITIIAGTSLLLSFRGRRKAS